MSSTTCEECYLPKSICICDVDDFDPGRRKEELLGRDLSLEERITAAIQSGTIHAPEDASAAFKKG